MGALHLNRKDSKIMLATSPQGKSVAVLNATEPWLSTRLKAVYAASSFFASAIMAAQEFAQFLHST